MSGRAGRIVRHATGIEFQKPYPPEIAPAVSPA
jgi:hypothetical protein